MKKVLITIALIAVIAVSTFAFVGCNNKVVIGVQKDTTGNKYVDGDADLNFAGFTNLQASPYKDGGLAVQAMLNGNCEYVIIDNGPAAELVAANNGKIKMIDIALTTEEYAYGVDKNNATLLAQVNAIIADLKTTGALDALYAKYESGVGITGVSAKTSADPSKAAQQLVVATNAAFEPFEYMIGDKFAGVDMEIAKLIADALGQELVILDMDFDSVVTSVGKNNVDIAMAGLTITETRKQSVTFSDAYYSGAYQVILCKADDTTFDNCKTKADVEKILAAK